MFKHIHTSYAEIHSVILAFSIIKGISLGIYTSLWSLLLTWINFNPSMDK